MTTTATGAPGSAADTSAADAATAASQAATDQATTDAAAAAATAAAGKTPEQVAAEAATAEAARVAAEAAKTAVPDKYELKLPDNAGVNTAIVEKTAAIARELGLSQDNAQKTLTFVAQEAAAEVQAQLASFQPPSDTNPEGGEKWREQDATWRAASLADKDLGNGQPEKLEAVRTAAKQVVAKYGDPDLIEFFEKSGLGSSPATLRFLNRIAQASAEGALVVPSAPGSNADKSEAAVASRIYDHPTSKKK